MAAEAWHWLGKQYMYVELGPFVIMPNHLHGVLIFREPNMLFESSVGAVREPPLPENGVKTQSPKRKPLGRVIGAFKTISTKQVNLMNGTSGVPLWQRNYYEHIVRTQKELDQIALYIETNPLQWASDQENPIFPSQ